MKADDLCPDGLDAERVGVGRDLFRHSSHELVGGHAAVVRAVVRFLLFVVVIVLYISMV